MSQIAYNYDVSCTPSSRANAWRWCAERHGGVLSQEGCWSKPAWEQAYDQSWKTTPLQNSHDFARARRGAACAACKSVTDVRLVTVETVVHQIGNIEIALMHRCSTAVLPGIVPIPEDGLHTWHEGARPRRVARMPNAHPRMSTSSLGGQTDI